MRTLLPLGILLMSSLCLAATSTPPPLTEPSPAREAPHDPGLESLAHHPLRPSWGPLPVLAGQTALLPTVTRALHHSQAVERQRALLVLGLCGNRASLPSLRFMTRDPDRAVRRQAGVALCLLGQADGLPGASATLAEGAPWQAYYALHGLWRVGDSQARKALRRANFPEAKWLQECRDLALAQPYRPAATPVPAPVEQLRVEPPDDPWITLAGPLIRECDWWWHQGNYDQSIRCQEAALFLDPGNVEVWGNVAWLQWSMGRHGMAVSTYHRGLRSNPRSWQAADQLALYYRLHKRLELAAKYFGLAAALGSPPIPRRQYGHVLEALGRRDEARRVWQAILKMDPNDPIARRQLQRLGEQ